MSDEANRREFSRSRTSFRVELSREDHPLISGTTQDVSMNGFLFQCDQELSLGTEYKVALFLGDESSTLTIRGEGKVARISSQGIAIQFYEIDGGSYGHLRNLVLYNAEDPDRVLTELSGRIGLNSSD